MDLTILTNFDEFMDISHIFSTQNVCFRQKEPTEDENEGDKRQSND